MKNILGQMNLDKKYNHKKGSYRIEDPFSNSSYGKSYRIESINFDVPIRGDKVMNANIKANILSDEEMLELGFLERPFYWEYRERVSFLDGMREYLVITIGKQARGININVYDEFIDTIYDYQSVLYDSEFDEYANRIHLEVQRHMCKLVDAGVIEGYRKNDYI